MIILQLSRTAPTAVAIRITGLPSPAPQELPELRQGAEQPARPLVILAVARGGVQDVVARGRGEGRIARRLVHLDRHVRRSGLSPLWINSRVPV